jgi:hypothetical protein
MKSVDDALSSLVTRAATRLNKRRLDALRIYSEGVKDELRQAERALANIKQITQGSIGAASDSEREVELAFMIDAYFAFSRAAYDVMGQWINQASDLGLDERKAAFATVAEQLDKESGAQALAGVLRTIRKSNYFCQLDDYRNCCLHRRSICLKSQSTKSKLTAGYRTTGPVVHELFGLCDDPLALNAKFGRQLEVSGYCESMLGHVEKHMIRICKEYSDVIWK